MDDIETSKWSRAFTQFQQRLRTVHPGVFQDDPDTLAWLSPAVVVLLNEHAAEIHPKRIQYEVGRPLDCHRNALVYVTMNEGNAAWFGFSLSLGCWWVHSWVVTEEGTLLDSGPLTTPAHYLGIPWGRELYEAIPKKADAGGPLELPPVLAQRKFRHSTDADGDG